MPRSLPFPAASSRGRRRVVRRRVGRSAVVGIAAATVVLVQAGVAFAAPGTPTAEVAISQSLTPLLHGASHGASGSDTLHFYARTSGASTWDLLNDVQAAGPDAYEKLPAGELSIGQAFDYQVTDCDSSGCTSSAVLTGYASPALGAGERPGGTRVPFTIGDKLKAQVDAGSGNLMLSTTLFSLPRRSGTALDVGLDFNSVTLLGQGDFSGSFSRGWRLSTGSDIRLRPKAQGAFVYYGAGGVTGTFYPNGTNSWAPPPGIKMTLAADGGGWKLTDHDTGQVQHFDGGGQLVKITDRNGNASTFTYNGPDVLTQIHTDQGGPGASTLTVSTAGNGASQITGISQTPDGGSAASARSVSFSYDPATGFLTGITDALGRTTTLYYGGANNLNKITAPGGAVTSFTYDAYGRVQTITQPTADPTVNAVTRFAYPSGQTLLADPNSDQTVSVGNAAHTTYALTTDGQLLVSSTTDPKGNKRSTTYTPFNDTASSTDASGNTTSATHTSNGGESLDGISTPTGASNGWQYQNPGAATQYQPSNGTDAQSNTSTYSYDGAGNGLSSTDAGTNKASVTRNGDGTVATSTNPSGAVTNYGYNTLGQQTSMTPPSGSGLGQRSFGYDGFGRLATITSGRGITTTYSYDNGDRLTGVTYSDGTPSVSYAYNPAGQVATRTDGTGTTSYGYDPLGRLTSRANTANGTAKASYSYDKAGNLATAVNAAGTTSYSYDTRETLASMTTPGIGGASNLIDFNVDGNGRRTDTWFGANGSGTNTSFAAHSHTDYDKSGRITRVWTSELVPNGYSSTETRISDLTYSYASPGTGSCPTAPSAGADTGLRWSQTDNLSGKTTSYCYDHSNRLTAASTPGGDTYAYSYDADGNRTKTTKNGAVVQTMTFKAGDVVTTPGYTVDADGNTTADSYAAETYDGADRLVTMTDGSGAHTFTYAGTNQVERITDGAGHNYTYGRTTSQGLPLIESYTDSGGTTYSYLYDNNGTPLAIEGANTHYLALDGLGSPVATINQNGTTTATYTYDPWGQTTATAQNGSGISSLQIYGYTGGTTDPAYHGLEHLGHRWYDPTTGRFTQQDDIQILPDPSRANRYTYAGDNPTNYVDPNGQSFLSWYENFSTTVADAQAEYIIGGAVIGCAITAFEGCIDGGAAGAVGGLFAGTAVGLYRYFKQ